LAQPDRRAIGLDLMRVQFRWPVGMRLCRAMRGGLWEVRTDLSSQRTARVLFHLHGGRLIVLHALIKKTQKTPATDLSLARKRMKDVTR
jgi:phage-related protein